jgi:dihydrofolate reductase
MRKLISWNMMTLDGFFEGPQKGEIDWHRWDDDMEKYSLDMMSDAGTLLFGRVTWEMFASHWPTAEGQVADLMNSVPKVVVSRTLDEPGWNNASLIKDDVPGEVRKLKDQPGGSIFVLGSADLCSTLIEHGLIDEYRIGVNPVLLGRGVALFKGGSRTDNLRLLEAKPTKSGVVILSYAPA